MVRVTGPSLETLYAYLNEQVGTRAPASHNHAQSEVTELASALDGKAPMSHAHAQEQIVGLADELSRRVHKSAPVITLNMPLSEVVDSGFYRLQKHPDLPPAAEYGQMIVSRGADTIAQIAIAYATDNIFYRHGNPPEAGGDGIWSAWKRLFHEGDAVAVRQAFGYGGYRAIVVPTTGWIYDGWSDVYYQDIAQVGMTYEARIYAACHVIGANFPLLAVNGIDNAIRIWMADIPAYEGTVYCDFFNFL